MEIKYQKNYLDKVIFQIDFANPIEELNKEIFPDLNIAALKKFPIYEPKNVIKADIEIKFDNKGESSNSSVQKRMNDWVFYGLNREKEMHINMDHLVIIYHKYTTFKPFKEDVTEICKTLFSENVTINLRKVDLRYINKIELNEDNPTEWKEYLNDNLLSIFNIYPVKTSILRAFHVLDLKLDDVNLKFQYGIYNSDFPAIIRKKEFILDYDAYHEGLIQNFTEMSEILEKCRKPIEELFESSITDHLKEKMNE